MNKNSIKTTIKKELRSIFRDKKTFLTLLIFPILIPIMIFLYSYMYNGQSTQKDYNIAINYQPNQTEKTLMKECHLKYKYYKTTKNMKQAYKNKKILGYIVYNKKKNKYTIYTNKDSEDGMYVANYTTAYLDSYNNYLAKLYLTGEDIDVDKVYDNFKYSIKNLDGENFILEMIFSISFTYIIMSIVLSSTNMATSATAVEKENGTLETLLTFPVKPSELIIGKYIATVILGILSSLIGLILTILSILIASNIFDIFNSITITITPLTIIIGIIICLASSLFISGLSLVLTAFSKTYKEAQSSSQVLSILTVIPMMISLIGIKTTPIYYLIPIANYVQLLMDIFSKNINSLNITIVLLSSVIYVIIVISYIIKQYKSEKVLFGE